ncbi:MAG: response regulator [Bacteroidetes bacterium]|nr:response regulator [Bacteroidota bacterium]
MESILVVDDDINLCTVLCEELNEIGYVTNYVTNADEAIQCISGEQKYDLILLDLKMPDKDGFYVLNAINENKINIKVIVLTAYADVKSAIDSARLGAADFISKPYDLDELLISVRRVLQQDED